MAFSKSRRLVSNRQFKAVLNRGVRVNRGLLMLYMAKNNCDYSRLGVSVSRSYGGAVARNRLKRLLREVFRQNQDKIPVGFDYLFTVSLEGLRSSGKSIAQPIFEQVNDSFWHLVSEAESLLKNTENKH